MLSSSAIPAESLLDSLPKTSRSQARSATVHVRACQLSGSMRIVPGLAATTPARKPVRWYSQLIAGVPLPRTKFLHSRIMPPFRRVRTLRTAACRRLNSRPRSAVLLACRSWLMLTISQRCSSWTIWRWRGRTIRVLRACKGSRLLELQHGTSTAAEM